MSSRERAAALALFAKCLACAVGCAAPGGVRRPPPRVVAQPPPAEASAGLRERDLRGADDPTVIGGRVLPGSLAGAHRWGTEAGGGERAVVSGVRVVSWRSGVLTGATQRLPATPSLVVELPERLGGGMVLALGPRLWRAETWLGPATPVFTAPFPIAEISLGLDRLYIRSSQGTLGALDPRTGAALGLGPIPASPRIARVAALDAWHEVALADLRGALVTRDAGSTWRTISLPIEVTDVSAGGGVFTIRGLDAARNQQAWQVSPEGETSWVSVPDAAPPALPPPAVDRATRAFGPQPLLAAVEDGWPMADGTAVVARDGAIARIRVSDGALLEAVAGAFPLDPARCHAVSLAALTSQASGGEGAAFGFVCGEPRGRTAIYAWDAPRSRMVELRRFDAPREVVASGNGALAVRGGCGPHLEGDDLGGPASAPTSIQRWCVRPPGRDWSEVLLRGEDADGARLVVLADGRSVLVRPPVGGDLSTARLTVTGGPEPRHLALRLPALPPDVLRALRWGTWLDGFEERRPGVLGGWIDAGGAVIGLELELTGDLRVGEYIREGGSPVVSGRWALGWTASGAGFETTDGGMTWAKEIEFPSPLTEGDAARERVCGPIGCAVAGWLRIGWRAPPHAPPPDAPPPHSLWSHRPPANLRLECAALAGKPPEGTARPAATREAPELVLGPKLGPASAPAIWGTVSQFPPFAGRAGPALAADERGVVIDVSTALDRSLRSPPLARLLAWGPGSGDWSPPGRWQVRWQSPWAGWPDARSSATGFAPWSSLEAARRAVGVGQGSTWTLAPGDDSDHALLIGQDAGTVGTSGAMLIELEADRIPLEVRTLGGEPLPVVEAAARSGGRWFIATVQRASEAAATVLWAIDGAVARELGRLPRLAFSMRPTLRMARRSDGRTLGLVLDGQPEFDHGAGLWVTAFDVETGAVADPERLPPVDLSDRTATLCTGDDIGWDVDLPYSGDVEVQMGRGWSASLQSPMARVRLLQDRACVERLSGSIGAYATTAPENLVLQPPSSPPEGDPRSERVRTVDVAVMSARTRFALRCHTL